MSEFILHIGPVTKVQNERLEIAARFFESLAMT